MVNRYSFCFNSYFVQVILVYGVCELFFRELALREELIRQEKLEQLAARFNRKASMRETWLSENQRLVSQDNFGFDLAAVEAAAKKHEAIETDIFAYEERVQAVVAVSQELEAENYHDIDRINAR
jgi:spectrin beta